MIREMRGRIITRDIEHETAQADSGRLPVGGGRQYAQERVRLDGKDVTVLVSYIDGVGNVRTTPRVEGRYIETTTQSGMEMHHLEGPLTADEKQPIAEQLIPRGYDRPIDFAKDHEFDRSVSRRPREDDEVARMEYEGAAQRI